MSLSLPWGRWALASLFVIACNGDRNNTAASGSGASGASEGGSESTTVEGTTSTSAAESSEGGTCRAPQTGGYYDCVNSSASVCDHEDASCLVNVLMEPVWGVCFLRCEEDCDCWDQPSEGTAAPRCAAVLSEGGSACILDCDDDRTCPSGMRCLGLNGVTRACVFDVEGLGTSGQDSSTSIADGDSGEDDSGSGGTSTDGTGESSASDGGGTETSTSGSTGGSSSTG